MKQAITNAKIFTGEVISIYNTLLIEEGRIISIQNEIPRDVDIIDLGGKNISAGLIDIQLNGGYQFYFSQFPDESTLEDMCRACNDFGTTYFLPTLISSTTENILKAIETVASFRQKFPRKGVLGMHLEGPFFNPDKRGAHNKNIVRKPTDEELRQIVQLGRGVIKLMTIAPEMFTDDQLTFLQENDILLSAGHSNMSYEQAQYYFDKGIHLTTHLYNAMSPFTHRAPGMTGAILDNENVYTSLILDGLHCDYVAARLACRLKKDKLFLITDSTFLGRRIRHFEWDTFDATIKNGTYRNEEGNLAGAAISMVEAVRNAKENLGISLQHAVEMATSYVGRAIGEEKHIGFIKEGYPARFFVFDDDLKIYSTLIL